MSPNTLIRFVIPEFLGLNIENRAYFGQSNANPEVYTELEKALEEADGNPVIVPLLQPGVNLAARLERDSNTANVFAAWLAQLREFIIACRLHRRRILCIDMAILDQDPESASAAIGERFGLDAAREAMELAKRLEPSLLAQSDDQLARIVADWIINNHAEASELVAELRAMTISAPELSGQPLDRVAAVLAKKAALDEEISLLRESLSQMLTDLEESIRKNRDAKDQVTKQAAKISELMDINAEQTEKLVELADVRSNATKFKEANAKLQHKLKTLQMERDALNNEIARIYRSKSWRITAPLRWSRFSLGRIFRSG